MPFRVLTKILVGRMAQVRCRAEQTSPGSRVGGVSGLVRHPAGVGSEVFAVAGGKPGRGQQMSVSRSVEDLYLERAYGCSPLMKLKKNVDGL